MIKGKCKLCCLERNLMQSHIIPEFMYQNLYDSHPKRYYSLKVNLDEERLKGKVEQKGIREYLLCSNCETKLSINEKYAAETLFGNNFQNKTFILTESKKLNELCFLYNFGGFSYKSFKMFLLSILFRLIISKYFNCPFNDPTIKEKLRVAIFNNDPLNHIEFGCIIEVFIYDNEEIAGGFIIEPYISIYNNVQLLNVFIDGFMFRFILNSHNLPEEMNNWFLKENGTIKIVKKLLYTDQILFKKVINTYKSFNH